MAPLTTEPASSPKNNARTEERRAYERAYYHRKIKNSPAHIAWLKDYLVRPETITRRKANTRRYWADPVTQERQRERNRKWYEENERKTPESPEAFAERRDRRKAREKGARVERVYRNKVWARDEGICHICGKLADAALWDLDHVIPISKGGVHAYWNVRVSHPLCNRRKKDNDPRLPGSRFAYLLEGLLDV